MSTPVKKSPLTKSPLKTVAILLSDCMITANKSANENSNNVSKNVSFEHTANDSSKNDSINVSKKQRSVTFDGSDGEENAKRTYPKTPHAGKSKSYIELDSSMETDSDNAEKVNSAKDDETEMNVESDHNDDEVLIIAKTPYKGELRAMSSSTPILPINEKQKLLTSVLEDIQEQQQLNDSLKKDEFIRSWSQSVRKSVKSSDKIDELGVKELEEEKAEKEACITKGRQKKTKILSDDESDREYFDEDEENAEDVEKNEFLDDEAEEVDGEEDTIGSEEREYIEMNEIPVFGEDLGSEDSEESEADGDEEQDDELDSFIASDDDDEDDVPNNDSDEDDLPALDKKTNFKRIQLISDSSDDDVEMVETETPSKEKRKESTQKSLSKSPIKVVVANEESFAINESFVIEDVNNKADEDAVIVNKNEIEANGNKKSLDATKFIDESEDEAEEVLNVSKKKRISLNKSKKLDESITNDDDKNVNKSFNESTKKSHDANENARDIDALNVSTKNNRKSNVSLNKSKTVQLASASEDDESESIKLNVSETSINDQKQMNLSLDRASLTLQASSSSEEKEEENEQEDINATFSESGPLKSNVSLDKSKAVETDSSTEKEELERAPKRKSLKKKSEKEEETDGKELNSSRVSLKAHKHSNASLNKSKLAQEEKEDPEAQKSKLASSHSEEEGETDRNMNSSKVSLKAHKHSNVSWNRLKTAQADCSTEEGEEEVPKNKNSSLNKSKLAQKESSSEEEELSSAENEKKAEHTKQNASLNKSQLAQRESSTEEEEEEAPKASNSSRVSIIKSNSSLNKSKSSEDEDLNASKVSLRAHKQSNASLNKSKLAQKGTSDEEEAPKTRNSSRISMRDLGSTSLNKSKLNQKESSMEEESDEENEQIAKESNNKNKKRLSVSFNMNNSRKKNVSNLHSSYTAGVTTKETSESDTSDKEDDEEKIALQQSEESENEEASSDDGDLSEAEELKKLDSVHHIAPYKQRNSLSKVLVKDGAIKKRRSFDREGVLSSSFVEDIAKKKKDAAEKKANKRLSKSLVVASCKKPNKSEKKASFDENDIQHILNRCESILEAANQAKRMDKMLNKKPKAKKIKKPLLEVSQNSKQVEKAKPNRNLKVIPGKQMREITKALLVSENLLLKKQNMVPVPVPIEMKQSSKRLPTEMLEAFEPPKQKRKKNIDYCKISASTSLETSSGEKPNQKKRKLKSEAESDESGVHLIKNPSGMFIEEPVVSKKKKKTKRKEIETPIGTLIEEPVTPVKKRTVSGFTESAATPKALGFKVRQILSAGQKAPPTLIVNKSAKKKKRTIQEPISLLPKPQWTSSGAFYEENFIEPDILLEENSATKFSLSTLGHKKSKKTATNLPLNKNALDFKKAASQNNKNQRESSKSMLQRREKQIVHSKF